MSISRLSGYSLSTCVYRDCRPTFNYSSYSLNDVTLCLREVGEGSVKKRLKVVEETYEGHPQIVVNTTRRRLMWFNISLKDLTSKLYTKNLLCRCKRFVFKKYREKSNWSLLSGKLFIVS